MYDVHNNMMVPSGILNLFQETSSCHYYNTTASASGNFYVNSSDLDIDYLNCNSQRISSKKHSANYFDILNSEDDYIDTPTLIKKVKLAKNAEK